MQTLRITIQTEPSPKLRPRTTFQFGRARTYTPQRTKDAEDFIRAKILKHKEHGFPAHVPLKLTCTFFRTKSQYLPKYETLPYRKPDIINFASLLCDSLSKILYDDDAQITTIVAKKRWSKDGTGHINIKLEEDKLQNEDNQESTD